MTETLMRAEIMYCAQYSYIVCKFELKGNGRTLSKNMVCETLKNIHISLHKSPTKQVHGRYILYIDICQCCRKS